MSSRLFTAGSPGVSLQADSPVAVTGAAAESVNSGAASSSTTATATATVSLWWRVLPAWPPPVIWSVDQYKRVFTYLQVDNVQVDNVVATLATDAGASSAAAGGGKCSEVPGADRTKLRSSDFVYAAITHCARAQLMEAHRSWRGAIPTFVTVDCDEAGIKALNDQNAKYGEHYAFYRNVTEADKGLMEPSAGLGYLRAGMTPTLAHRHFTAAGQAYKWLMWGDDDTLFLMPPILKALENIDPEQPWVFSGEQVSAGAVCMLIKPQRYHPKAYASGA